MKKSHLLLAAAVAAFALAGAAFASPPATASPGFEPVKIVKQDISTASPDSQIVVADSGSGAQSALKAFTAKRAAVTLPAPRQISAAGLGLDARHAATAWARPERSGVGLSPASTQQPSGLSIQRYRT